MKERADIIGAFKVDPLYLKHKNQESGRNTLKLSNLGYTVRITDSNKWLLTLYAVDFVKKEVCFFSRVITDIFLNKLEL